MFGKSLFNRTLFDRVLNSMQTLYLTVTSEFGAQLQKLHVLTRMRPVELDMQSNIVVATLGAYTPLAAVTMEMQSAMTARIRNRVKLPAAQIDLETSLDPPSMRLSDSASIALNGIRLAPGQTLVIDTDTLDIYVDGVATVDGWVVGSNYFPLLPGTNIIQVYDDASSRTLSVNIQWADRYL